jgi:hypothetical protein
MELLGKPDFAAALRRIEAWWHRQIVDRPPVTINVAPDRPARFPPSHHADPRQRWLDAEYNVRCAAATLESGVYLAEAFPCYHPVDNPEVVATVFGARLEFTPHGVRTLPFAPSCLDCLALTPNLDSLYWSIVRKRTALSLELGQGRWVTAVANMHAGGDLVATLRGPQPLCLDVIENPAGVRAACDHLAAMFPAIFQDLWSRIRAAGQPCTAWSPLAHSGPAWPVACDFLSMISPRAAEATVMPSLAAQIAGLARSLFHLDGPLVLHHLDAVLALPHLDAVQWVYGPGNGPATRWIDVYKKIQAAGKAVQLVSDNLDDARAAAEALHPEGIWFCPDGRYSRSQAEDFIAWSARWAAGKAL